MSLYRKGRHRSALDIPFPASCSVQWSTFYDLDRSSEDTQTRSSPIILSPGQPIDQGLSKEAAADLGLCENTPVGVGIVDGYAGWIGTIGAQSKEESVETSLQASKHRLAVIAGTSTCLILQSNKAALTDGVWPPGLHAIFPGCECRVEHFLLIMTDIRPDWMHEGGQPATGQLLDFVIDMHPARTQLDQLCKSTSKSHFDVLENILDEMRQKEHASSLASLVKDLHVYPDIHGRLQYEK